MIPGILLKGQANVEVVDLLTKTMLINEIGKMSNLGPTSGVEAYYSVVNHFAPKMYKFSYKGMISRILLAAMHYNENAGRVLKVTRQGKKCDSIVYRKYRNGGYSQRKVLVNCTYGICK